MGLASNYWKFTRIDPAHGYRTQERQEAQTYFQQQVLESAEQTQVVDQEVQTQLAELRSSDPLDCATLCLRCFVSGKILAACLLLAEQHGEQHGFTQEDLLPFVLTDDGRPEGFVRSLAYEILQSFQPSLGSLSAWTIRLVKAHDELNQFLLQQGVFRMTDWGILNNFNLPQLQHILRSHYRFKTQEIERFSLLLESYHAIYTIERRRSGKKGRCVPPTELQLQQISKLIRERTKQVIPVDKLLDQLKELSDYLREYSIIRSGGRPLEETTDTDEMARVVDEKQTEPLDLAGEQQTAFLHQYRQLLIPALDQGIHQAVSVRLTKFRNDQQRDRYLTALRLFYCDHLSQSEIARRFDVTHQSTIAHLLKLPDLRSAVLLVMHQILKSQVKELASNYLSPKRLEQLDENLETLLSELIHPLIQEDATWASTPSAFAGTSVFADRMCQYLDQRNT